MWGNQRHEDEALEHLYYRKSMKRLALEDLQKAYGRLRIKKIS